ncbi:MAG: hypothetical protein EXR62_07935 [Chloroflexi bacterium]|nr:hypothetical protein [Chloroflexota bacterium]
MDFVRATRDVFIILLALETFVIGIFLIILILQIRSLMQMLQKEVKPILDSVQDTSTTIRGTTVFLSDNVAAPLIRMASFAAGAGRAVQIIRGGGKSEKS